MKILPVVVFFLVSFFSTRLSFSQENIQQDQYAKDSQMKDTSIILDHSFSVKRIYAAKDSLASVRKVKPRKQVMQDTIVTTDPAFVVRDQYASKDSLVSFRSRPLTKRDLLVKAIKDSLTAIGNALMRRAEMQDTTIVFDTSFVLKNIYAEKDRLDASRDSLRISLARSAVMQDTTLSPDPSFEIKDLYAKKDKLDAVRDSLARPASMQDTVIAMDLSFFVRDLYPVKDSLALIKDSLKAVAEARYTDSVRIHWAGWRNYVVQPGRVYTLNSQRILKGRSRAELQYNIADFYLYLNGELVRPSKSPYDFFTAACLAFKYDDTLLLNSGLGFKVGVGVGIKIFKGKFSSSLHANTRNKDVYKLSKGGNAYEKNIISEAVTQSLKLRTDPAYASNGVIVGEYQASYKKFYQKNEDGKDEVRRYTVKIVFRCRVTGGIDSVTPIEGAGTK